MTNYIKYVFFFTLLLCGHSYAQGIITTIAGGGGGGCFCYSGDNGPATDAALNHPWDVQVDDSGNIYIADAENSCIRKVNTAGIITTIAGTGSPGFSGDGFAATDAQLHDALGLALDHKGNLYIADAANNRIRKVDTAGIITTIAGDGTTVYAGENIPATASGLTHPSGVAIDRLGNLYICNSLGYRIQKVDTSGVITTIAGTGVDGATGDSGPATEAGVIPVKICIDSSLNIYFTDSNRVRKINTSGIITTIAGNGTTGFSVDSGEATSAVFYNPDGIAVNNSGVVWIADVENYRIRQIDAAGTITTIAGTNMEGFSGDHGPATLARLSTPEGVAVDTAGNIYIADQGTNRIRVIKHGVSAVPVNDIRAQIRIFPNPCAGRCMVSIYSPVQESVLLQITDVTGRKLQEIHCTTNSETAVSISEPGLFYLSAITAGSIATQKLVITH